MVKPDPPADNDTFFKRNKGGVIFFGVVASVSSVVGFGYTYMNTKKQEMLEMTAQTTPAAVKEQMIRMRSGSKLASRALLISWICSISGVSLIAFTAWKLSGAKNLSDFRRVAGSSLPHIPKPSNPGRQNFESLKDLADFLEEEDKRSAASPSFSACAPSLISEKKS